MYHNLNIWVYYVGRCSTETQLAKRVKHQWQANEHEGYKCDNERIKPYKLKFFLCRNVPKFLKFVHIYILIC